MKSKDNSFSSSSAEIVKPTKIRLYSDLNCPFCFVMHERIEELKLAEKVECCLVEHAPGLNSQAMTESQAALLAHEFDLISQRAKDVVVKHPSKVVNSQLALQSQISLELIDVEKGAQYRCLLYKAYWQQGKDISDPQVLHEILVSLGEQGLTITDEGRKKSKLNQQQWEQGAFERRIPVMESASGQVMLGLQNHDSIKDFVTYQQTQAVKKGEACLHHGDFTLAVLGPEILQLEFKYHSYGFSFFYYENVSQLVDDYSNLKFDGIIINFDYDRKHNFSHIRHLKEKNNIGLDMPIIYYSQVSRMDSELQAFTLGANEFVHQDSGIETISIRIKTALNQGRIIRLLHNHAAVDGLTGLLNKREFQQQFEREWRHACRKQLEFSLVMIDIDYFKSYNDNNGHCKGDEVLREVAKCLSGFLYRAKDILARFGGEEFVILLPDTHHHGLEFVCQQLRYGIEELHIPHPTSAISEYVTISIGGCCAYPHADQSAQQLLQAADDALYQAKDRGRNQYVIAELPKINYNLAVE